jgi:NADPH:quinone reductase-like Zn-dependent oxidoreductase
LEGSGTVVAVGSGVKTLKPGDEVYGIAVDKPMFREEPPGWASEYAMCDERFLTIKPLHLPHAEAASMMGNTVSTSQAFRKGLDMRGLESMEGMTVYVTAGLGGLGSMAIQLAKRVFKADRIITTVSTSKVSMVDQLLPGMVDQVVDYQKTQTLTDRIQPGTVDFVINTLFSTFPSSIPLLNPSSGILINMTGLPSRQTAVEIFGDRFTWWMGLVLYIGQYYYTWKLRRTHIAYAMVSGSPNIRADFEAVAKLIAEEGLLRPVISTAEIDDIEAVRTGCEKLGAAKGGVGRFVITIP